MLVLRESMHFRENIAPKTIVALPPTVTLRLTLWPKSCSASYCPWKEAVRCETSCTVEQEWNTVRCSIFELTAGTEQADWHGVNAQCGLLGEGRTELSRLSCLVYSLVHISHGTCMLLACYKMLQWSECIWLFI